jgi:DhnA family fructose-bisphosphate aldolase class Ia
MPFTGSEFLPASMLASITDIRVHAPNRALQAAQERRRRLELAPSGKLNLLAADHPGRRVTAAAGNPLAMADRGEYLARIVRVLMSAHVDGVMATMDVLEDLLLLQDLTREESGIAFLDGKVMVASLNRGGLAGTAWEMDDPMTGATPHTCAHWRLDGAKLLLRICDGDPGSLATIKATAQVVSEMNALPLPTFVEPLPVEKTESGYKVIKTPDALAKIAGVASALGDSSHMMWLKLPGCPNFEIVARATTLPILLLGGESSGDPRPFLRELSAAMRAGPTVRGALVGRNVMFPGEEDPLVIAEAVGLIIHEGQGVDAALEQAGGLRGRNMDYLAGKS